MQGIVEQYQQEHDVPAAEIAAALAQMAIGDQPLLMVPERQQPSTATDTGSSERPARSNRRDARSATRRTTEHPRRNRKARDRLGTLSDRGWPEHGVQPANIVGAIANEAGLDAAHIGQVDIRETSAWSSCHRHAKDVLRDLKKAWVCGQTAGDHPLDC